MTTKTEYTGAEFEIEFHERYLEWLKGGKFGTDPRTDWEFKDDFDGKFKNNSLIPSFDLYTMYRWKPAPKRTVTIGYSVNGMPTKSKTLVAPEVECPKDNTFYWVEDSKPDEWRWRGTSSDCMHLKSGRVFLAREDAQAMADWLAVCRRGGV